MVKKIAQKLSKEQYQKNFFDVKPPLNKDSAIAEANRCLYCYDAPCITACPTKIDIPSFIKKIATQNFRGSARVILESNIMGGTCARVCPVETLCEGSCVYNNLEQKPIDIGRLQRFSTDWLMDNNIKLFERGTPNGKKVAIIGAGPSGLSCAHRLSQLGYETTVFESKDLGGGLNTFGLAEYKITRDFALKEVDFVTEIGGIEIKYNTVVGKDVAFSDLLKDYDAVFLGIGLGTTPKLRVEGEDLDGVVDAIEFIEELKRGPHDKVNIGQTVAVIGAGNTAIDAATQAKRLGANKVYIVYRRTQKEMPAYEYEYGLALKDECEFLWQSHPVKILGDDHVTGMQLVKMALGEPDASGRRVPAPVEGSEFTVPVDMVIKALGQKPYESFLSNIEGLELNNGKVKVNENMQTSIPKLFAGGDCINGGKETVNAVQDGKIAALNIHKMIFGETGV
ncbi:MAG: NAD(P)-dependent oxidoreductase [Candidatus Sericytochromatia bacterium]